MCSQAQLLSRIAKPKSQQGVALILAMMIVTLIAIVATEISWRFELSTSRSGNRWAGIQSRAYLDAVEQFAMIGLRADQEDEQEPKADHMGEAWAEYYEFPLENAFITGQLSDAQGRFNINLMKPEDGTCKNGGPKNNDVCPPPGSACDDFTEAQRVFVRLLQTFNIGSDGEELYLNQQQAQEITEAVIDWLDTDSNIRGFGGAESDYYDQLDPPITIVNNEMASVSELQVIKGIPPLLYSKLTDYVIALPKAEVQKININNSKENVLRSLRWEDSQGGVNISNCDLSPIGGGQNTNAAPQGSNINDSESDDVAESAGGPLENFVQSNEFEDWPELTGHPDLPYDWTQGGQGYGLGQNLIEIGQSRYFILDATVQMGDEYFRSGKSLIKREVGGADTPQQGQVTVKVIRRTDANF